MKKIAFTFIFLLTLTMSCAQKNDNSADKPKIKKSDEQWKNELTPQQYDVLIKKGTDAPFTGKYVNTFEEGKYVCAACGNELFVSDSKFHSDCGWPSFDQAIKGSVTYKKDYSFGMTRTEVMCSKCGGHLGHVFEDGPQQTTGMRYCTNSTSIKFIPDATPKKSPVKK